MIYPKVKLSDVTGEFFQADYPEDPERGSFLKISADGDTVAVRVDRFSTIPFYYAIHEGRLYGATTLRLLLEDAPANFPRSLNVVAAIEFLRANSMIGDKTLLEGIERVPPGCELRFDRRSGAVQIEPYWKLPGDVRRTYTETTALEALHEAFTSAVRRASEGARSVGLHLSGGMDSRQLLGALLELRIPCVAFTYGVEENLDVAVARRLAKRLGVKHVYRRWEGIEGFRRNFPMQMELTDGMQALIHGHGIDMREEEARRADRLLIGHFLDLFIQSHIYNPVFERGDYATEARLYELFDGGPCSALRGDCLEPLMLEAAWRGCYRESVWREIRKTDYMIPEKRYDAMYFVHHGLRRLMPQSHAASHFLDCRLPGLAGEFFDVAWSIPGALKKRRRLQEKLLQRWYPATVNRARIVMDNERLAYIGPSPLRRLAAELDTMLRYPRVGILKPRYRYYYLEIRRMANAELYPWMKKELTASPLRDAGFLKPEFIDFLFDGDEFKEGFPLSFYGALMTLHGFVRRYLGQ